MPKLRDSTSNPLGLPPRCYWKNGAFHYVHRDTNRWERLGTDVAFARERAKFYNDDNGEYGTVAWFLDEFLVHFAELVEAKTKAPRTLEDYKGYAVNLKAFFGKMAPTDVQAHHIDKYLDMNLKAKRGSVANKEKACLSSMFSWMRLKDKGGIKVNPCSHTGKNPTKKRSRYVTDEQYAFVQKNLPSEPAKLALRMAYLTLQRPEDVCQLTRSDIIQLNGQTVLRIEQSKHANLENPTTVHIAVEGDLKELLDQCSPTGVLIKSRLKKAFKAKSIGGMIRKLCAKHGEKPFGLQDMKAKAATDMFNRGVQLQLIQALCGHKKITTTEIYVKQHNLVISTSNKSNSP